MKWLYYTVLLLACCRMAGCGSDKDSVSVLPSDPPAPEEPEYVDPTAGFKEVGPYGSMEDMIPDEHPDSEFSQCYYNYFCLCNKSSHTLTVAVSSKWKNIGGFYDREQNIPVISDRKFSALIGMVLSNHSTTFGQYLLSMTRMCLMIP